MTLTQVYGFCSFLIRYWQFILKLSDVQIYVYMLFKKLTSIVTKASEILSQVFHSLDDDFIFFSKTKSDIVRIAF